MLRRLIPLLSGALACTLYASCIGTDYLDDAVDPELRITTSVDRLVVGETFQLDADYFNQVGQPETVTVSWESSAPAVVEVSPAGLARALSGGTAQLRATYTSETLQTRDSFALVVDSAGGTTAPMMMATRGGSLVSQSSYELSGTFSLTALADGAGLTIELAGDYVASDALPGLYVYLTNNPNSIAGALEIGPAKVFAGAHSYRVTGAGLEEYSHLLYYCKPFGVRVGSGEIK